MKHKNKTHKNSSTMDYYKIISGDEHHYYADNGSDVTEIVLNYRETELESADYIPDVELPSLPTSSNYEEFKTAWNTGSDFGSESFVGTSPIHH